MAIGETVEFAPIDKFYLDPNNPRLRRRGIAENSSQDDIREALLKHWALEELAISFLESGFWTQEALVVVEEEIQREKVLVVVEGNRRLAALQTLRLARKGRDVPKTWKRIAKQASAQHLRRLLERIPYVLADSRDEIQAYLGFRHVTGIKEWHPAEKAEFIAHLIEDQGLSYEEVMRRIGSTTPVVRQQYIAYRLLLEMQQKSDRIAVENVEERFSVLYLSLRTHGVQKYLHIDIMADPATARRPVKASKLKHLENFALWLFGTEDQEPLVADSRQVDKFGRILESQEALEYLQRTDQPSFERAFRLAGGGELETAKHVERAADNLEEALSTAHLYRGSSRLEAAALRAGRDIEQLLQLFPGARRKLRAEVE